MLQNGQQEGVGGASLSLRAAVIFFLKEKCRNFAGSSIYLNVARFEVSVCHIFFPSKCVCNHSRLLSLTQHLPPPLPTSFCTWFSSFLLLANRTCVLVCVCCWRSARFWLSSTTADRHVAPSPGSGSPQGKGSFFPQFFFPSIL